MEMLIKEIEKLIQSPSIHAWITAWLWWFAHYLYAVSKWEKFQIYMLLINMFLAFWLWTIVYSFIPDSAFKWGIVGIVGFSTHPILLILEEKGVDFIEKYLKTK